MLICFAERIGVERKHLRSLLRYAFPSFRLDNLHYSTIYPRFEIFLYNQRRTQLTNRGERDQSIKVIANGKIRRLYLTIGALSANTFKKIHSAPRDLSCHNCLFSTFFVCLLLHCFSFCPSVLLITCACLWVCFVCIQYVPTFVFEFVSSLLLINFQYFLCIPL